MITIAIWKLIVMQAIICGIIAYAAYNLGRDANV